MFQDLQNKQNILKKHANKGYTLIEIAISVLFFAIVALGISLPFGNSISLTVDNKNINAANNLARSYLKDVEANWSIQSNFDEGNLIEVDSAYTNDGKYDVTVISDNISINDIGIVVVRRINIKYKDNKGRYLTDLYYDYNRPGNL